MKIRTRLTLQFLLIGAAIIIMASFAIYYSSSVFRSYDFYNRLKNNSLIAAKLLLDADIIDASRVERLEKDNPGKLHDERIIIINFRDDTLYSSDRDGFLKVGYDQLEKIRLYDELRTKKDKYSITGTLYSSRFDRFVVLAAANDIEGKFFLSSLRSILLLTSLISLVIIGVSGWIYAGRALKPIADVIKSAGDISINRLDLRLSEGNGTDEIAMLAKTFNTMLKRLETGFHMQKDFIANASHEIRTPLTAINGQIEVLMLKDRTGEEYKAALASVLDDIRSLITLSNRLLLMARTASESEANPGKKVRVDEILWQAKDDVRKVNGIASITITLAENVTESDQIVVAGDEFLLRTAIANLLENGCKYSDNKTVNATLGHNNGLVELIIADNGIGIPEKETAKVFEPFYRGSNAKTIKGTGIGLALVSQIIKKHEGTIVIESEPGKGTKITVRLPVFS